MFEVSSDFFVLDTFFALVAVISASAANAFEVLRREVAVDCH